MRSSVQEGDDALERARQAREVVEGGEALERARTLLHMYNIDGTCS